MQGPVRLWSVTTKLTVHPIVVNQCFTHVVNKTFKDRSALRYYKASPYLIRRTSSSVSHQIIWPLILGIYGWRDCCEWQKKKRTNALSIMNVLLLQATCPTALLRLVNCDTWSSRNRAALHSNIVVLRTCTKTYASRSFRVSVL